MEDIKRVAVVTGSNKGIGYAIVRGLCRQFDGDVYLAARNEERGTKAIEDLKKEGSIAKYHQLDINDPNSIATLGAFLHDTYGGLDVLVNNAGTAFKTDSTSPVAEQAEVTLRTNFWGTLDVCEALFPLLRPHARVVNISSRHANVTLGNCSEELQRRFLDTDHITVGELKTLMRQYVECAQSGTVAENGWPTVVEGLRVSTAYGVSKIGVTVMSIIQQRELLRDSRPDIVVNACSPGYVATDLTSNKGHKTTTEGADTPLYLCTFPHNIESPKGELIYDRDVIDWKPIT